jgi:flagellar biosynthetic protein FlhB
LKQRRKQLHAEFRKQAEGMGKLPGSDMLIVNPEHYAVALAYEPSRGAPAVTTKARNNFALALKREAFRLGIPIFENRVVARELFKSCAVGAEIGAAQYRAVADMYVKLRASTSSPSGPPR